MRRLLTILFIALIVVAVAVFCYGQYTTVRADLVGQREAIDAEWSQVDIALEQRADVLTRILPAGPGTADLLQACATLEAAKSPRDKIAANTRISQALSKMSRPAAGENYQRLSDAENRIAVERRRYNEMLEHYNAQIQRFPDNIVASIAGFHRDDNYLPTEPGTQP